MVGIRFRRLVDQFTGTLERFSATVLTVELSDSRPAMIRVITGDGTTDCKLFLWTITPGGGGSGVRPENERRIQITNVTGMPLLPGVRTLLGGWSTEFGVYSFWDARRHIRFSNKSPSLQVDAATLEAAGRDGLAARLRPTREGQEVVIAVAESALLWYVQNGLALHNAELDAQGVGDLIQATPEDERAFLDEAETEIAAARRYDLVETMRAYRDAKFRPAVLQAYRYRCAVCNCDLKLVDAAHIVPVSHPSSTDDVTNGLALCRLHHGAFDNGLLGVQSNYRIVINYQVIERLRTLNLAAGFEAFNSPLPPQIQVPSSIEARPSPHFLRIGLRARKWPEDLIA